MFDKINFVRIVVDTPPTGDMDEAREAVIRHNQENARSSGIDTSLTLAPLNSDFYIHGEAQYLFAVPMLDAAKKGLLFIQSFSLMNMNAHYYTRRKFYASFLLLYTYDGSGILEYENETYTLNPGDGFLIDCRKPHYYHTNGQHWHHSDLHFYGGNSEFLYQEFVKKYSVCFHTPQNGSYQEILEQILKVHTGSLHYRELQISHLLEKLILFLLMQEGFKSQIPENISYLLTYMERHYTTPFTLEELSKFCGISKYHMSREFKKYTDFAPLEYLNKLRLEHAKELLLNTDLPAYKIAVMSGIPNEANFIRLFKKQEKCTPGEFRSNANI